MKFPSLFLSICAVVAVADDETCFMPIDVMFLQDTTGSFEDDLPLVVQQIPSMVSQILEQNPGSYFGVAEFKDKPYFPLGIESDFCYKLGGPLTPLLTEFQYDYSQLYASGGGDLPESQFQALINVAQDPNVGWRNLERPASRAGESAGAHLVIMSTDAPPHLDGDIVKYHASYPDTVPASLPVNPGSSPNNDFVASCRNYDYPSAVQMAEVLRAHAIYLAILTPDQANITGAWKWVNEALLGQPSGFYQYIESDSSDLIDGVLKVIKEVTKTACAQTLPPEYTTTPMTTTTVPTTTTEATTTTQSTTTTTTTQPTTTTTTTESTTTTTTTTEPITTTTTQPTTSATTTAESTTTTPATTTTTPTTTTQSTTTTTIPETVTSTPIILPSPATAPTEIVTAVGTPQTLQTTTSETPQSVTTVGTTQTLETTVPQTSPAECHHPCPPMGPCCGKPAVLIEVNQRPKRLVIQYEK